MSSDDRVDLWLTALDQRFLSEFTLSEVGRALRALSSCYVERRSKLGEGGALGSAGKRAAFALFYAPLHFLATREIVRALPIRAGEIGEIVDLGCGTGAAGAAWAIESPSARVLGVDRHPWAVAEAIWTYRQLALKGRARQQDLARFRLEGRRGSAILAAYAINELPDTARPAILARMIRAHDDGARVLVIEPIARRLTPWWKEWESAFAADGGRSDEWRFPVRLPSRQRELAKAAGLNPGELTARSLLL
jgi:SAM-dependent methyltransferase